MKSDVVHQYAESGGGGNWSRSGTVVGIVTTNYNIDAGNLSSLSWPPPLHAYTTVQIAVISLVVAVLSAVTAGGNLMVIISFRMDRQLQTVSNYFLLSLSVADFAIGLVSMPLYTVYLLMNRWPLGPLVCDAWLSLDYTMSNASVANLLVISFDRYFSVTRPLTYRVRRTPRTAAALIAGAWLVSVLLWTPWIIAWPHIEGRREVLDHQCYIQFLETNKYITIVTAVAAFYLPVLAMCVVYYRIYRETEKRQRGLLYLQATSSSLRRLHKTPTIEEDPPAYVETSSRRSSGGRATSTNATPTNVFIQSPTPLHYRIRLRASDASEQRRPRRRRKCGRLTHRLCCGRSTSQAVIHTPPRKSSYSADDAESLPATDQPGQGTSANEVLQNPPAATDSCLQPNIPMIRVRSMDTRGNRSANVASNAADSPAVETCRPAPVESTAAPSTSMTDMSGTAQSLRRTGRWQVCDTAGEQFLRDNEDKVIAKRSVAVEALLLDRDRPDITTDDLIQIRRASESLSIAEDTPSTRRRQQQQSQAASDALRQALEKRINERLTDTARKAQKQRQEKKQDRKAAKTLSAILLAFIVTWTPYNVFTVVRTFVPGWIDPTVYAIGGFLHLLRCINNTVRYCLTVQIPAKCVLVARLLTLLSSNSTCSICCGLVVQQIHNKSKKCSSSFCKCPMTAVS